MAKTLTNPRPQRRARHPFRALLGALALAAVAVLLAKAAFDQALDDARLARSGARTPGVSASAAVATRSDPSVPDAASVFAGRVMPEEEPVSTF